MMGVHLLLYIVYCCFHLSKGINKEKMALQSHYLHVFHLTMTGILPPSGSLSLYAGTQRRVTLDGNAPRQFPQTD